MENKFHISPLGFRKEDVSRYISDLTSRYTIELEDLNRQIASLKSELEGANNQLSRIAECEENLSQTKEVLMRAENALREAEEENMTLRESLRSANEKVKGNERQIEDAKNREHELEHTLENLNAEMDSVKREYSSRTEEAARLNEKLSTAKDEMSHLTNELVKLRKSNESMRNSLNSLDDENASLKAHNKRLVEEQKKMLRSSATWHEDSDDLPYSVKTRLAIISRELATISSETSEEYTTAQDSPSSPKSRESVYEVPTHYDHEEDVPPSERGGTAIDKECETTIDMNGYPIIKRRQAKGALREFLEKIRGEQ